MVSKIFACRTRTWSLTGNRDHFIGLGKIAANHADSTGVNNNEECLKYNLDGLYIPAFNAEKTINQK